MVAPESITRFTMSLNKTGVHPNGVGEFDTSCVAKINHPLLRALFSMTRTMAERSDRLCSIKKAFR